MIFVIQTFFFQERESPVGVPETAMRDPVFYRLHALINEIFLEHKNLLPRYTTEKVISISLCIHFILYRCT